MSKRVRVALSLGGADPELEVYLERHGACLHVRGDSKAFGRPLAISYDSRGERNVHEVSFVRRRSHFTRSTEDLTDPIVSFTPDRPGDLQSRQARRALAQQLQRTRAPASLVAWATRRPHVAAGGVEPADRP